MHLACVIVLVLGLSLHLLRSLLAFKSKDYVYLQSSPQKMLPARCHDVHPSCPLNTSWCCFFAVTDHCYYNHAFG